MCTVTRQSLSNPLLPPPFPFYTLSSVTRLSPPAFPLPHLGGVDVVHTAGGVNGVHSSPRHALHVVADALLCDVPP